MTESITHVCRFLNSIDDSVINPLAAELSRFLLNKLKLYLFQSDKFICNKHPIIVIPQRRKIDNEWYYQAGWWWEAGVVVGGRHLWKELGASCQQQQKELKAVEAATNQLLCWGRPYQGDKLTIIMVDKDLDGCWFRFQRLTIGYNAAWGSVSKPQISFSIGILSEGLPDHWEEAEIGNDRCCGQDLLDKLLQVENEIHLLEVLNLQKVSVSVAKADQANHHGDHHGRDHHGLGRPLRLQLQVLRGNREDSMGGAWGDSHSRVLLFLKGHNRVGSWCGLPLLPEQEKVYRQVVFVETVCSLYLVFKNTFVSAVEVWRIVYPPFPQTPPKLSPYMWTGALKTDVIPLIPTPAHNC